MKEYFNRLDSLRFLAFAVVFVSHLTYFLRLPRSVIVDHTLARTFLQNGDLGVSFFFVLSGFLITYLLEKEYQKTGTLSFKKFYSRRILRIWPLYFLAIGIIVVMSASFGQHFSFYKLGINGHEIAAFLLLFGNVYRVFWNTANDVLTILWSIAVEEQFYLVWPLLFFIFRKHILWVLGILAIVSLGFSYHYGANFEAREFYTPCVMIYLMVGSLCGIYASRFKETIKKHIGLIISSGIIITLLLTYIRGVAFVVEYPGWFASLQSIIFSACFAGIILACAYWEGESNVGTTYLGKISYGLYVYHLIALTIVFEILSLLSPHFAVGAGVSGTVFVLIFGAALLLTVGLASLSYFYWERPFLKFKDRLEESFSL